MLFNLKPAAPQHVVATSITRAIDDAVSFARRYGWVVTIVGPSGIGKSTALLHLSEADHLVRYNQVADIGGIRPLYHFVAAAMGWATDRPRSNETLAEILHQNFSHIANGCSAKMPCLVADEAQNLAPEFIRALLTFNDAYRIPIVLAGNPRTLKRPHVNQDDFAQITSRVSKLLNLRAPLADDFRSYVEARGVRDRRSISALVAYGQRTSFRSVRDILEVASDLAGTPADITLSHLESALAVLTDAPSSSARLFKPVSKAIPGGKAA